ncbi:MAG: aminoglycoside phosphotransferase family protein [Clostridia bacterium]|nr:aminoglycoside phosphotransferase family protein [Clostridia bacterium]
MERIYQHFVLEGNPVYCQPYGNGHINDTYLLLTDMPHAYILQRLNTHVFRDVPGLMDNIIAVTDHLRKYDPDPRHVLTLVHTVDGKPYLATEDGEYWRMYEFVTASVCLEQPESVNDMRQAGVAFGRFQRQLADFPAEKLNETIPQFHDVPARFEQLRQAIRENRAGRLHEVQYEMTFFMLREEEASRIDKMKERGDLPLRVTHNDTKLDNVMLDKVLHMPLCVIDLDTVMPGLSVLDFGDAIRGGASTGAEDETDLRKVSLSLDLFEAYANGYLSTCGTSLTQNEIETLAMGAKTMTIECGVRFLTDYLNGDVYFHTTRPGQNLDRCRTQMKLVEDMEAKWQSMLQIIKLAAR